MLLKIFKSRTKEGIIAQALVLNKALSRGQTLLSVPASRWITVDTVAASDISEYVSRLQPWLQVALFILHEKANSR